MAAGDSRLESSFAKVEEAPDWINCARVARPGCRLIIRFGAINDRRLDAGGLLKKSLAGTPWRVLTCHNAGTASQGKRQANAFVPTVEAMQEYDLWATN